ncbi:MAG: cell division protein FtsZ [Dehalococcoidia bacterium]|nr:cell division protein FtsZ [Dehalococcoidia bacterium]
MAANPDTENFAKIKVVGVGGGGCNAVNRMIQEKIHGVDFIAVNTDAQALLKSDAPLRLRIGDKLTKGLGVGGDAVKGQKAAEESRDVLFEALDGANMVFIAAGMGGGTGTGAAPTVAEIARETGALTVAVVTKPFTFEGSQRRQAAEEGIARLKEKVDAVIVIPNDRLLSICDKKATLEVALRTADDVLRQGIQGISELVTMPGNINLDFNDVKTVMSDAGSALMAIGHGSGETRAVDAARLAISSPLLDVSIEGAKRILLSFASNEDLTLFELNEAAEMVRNAVDSNATIIFGTTTDSRLNGEVKITIIATGFEGKMSKTVTSSQHAAVAAQTPTRVPSPLRLVNTIPAEDPQIDVPIWLRNGKAK